ncbi:MAG: isochorismatase family protein [Mariniblastus sp.]|nr:isochorismatase family protein [Mariniblastus sp.]
MTENSKSDAPRSPLMMNRKQTALVVIDVQEKLLPLIDNHVLCCWNIGRLAQGCRLLEIPVVTTEQYPAGLGNTIASLSSLLQDAGSPFLEKTMFSVRELASVFEQLKESGIQNLILTGVESHVCIMQSALDLMSQGFDVFLPVDAISSRYQVDHETALCRLETSGATLVTTEMVLFELCVGSDSPEFKGISQLVKEEPPEENRAADQEA